jgi:hypothetical protein
VRARARRLSRERHARSRRPQQPARDDAEHQRPGRAARDRRRHPPLGQDFSTRLLDERFKTFEAQMVGHQKSLDAIQALIETSRVNPEGSPIVRQYLEWRATVETRLTEFQRRADRQDGVVTGSSSSASAAS